MLPIDLSGKRAFVAGVADDGGFGFAIAKAMAEAGALDLRRDLAPCPEHLPEPAGARQDGRLAHAARTDGSWRSRRSTRSTPPSTRWPTRRPTSADNKRYKERGDYSIEGVVAGPARRFRRPASRHRGPLPGQRPRGQEAADRHHPRRLPRPPSASAHTATCRWSGPWGQ